MRFVFRTHADQATGLGHLIRSLHLARALQARGEECIFVLDYLHPIFEELVSPFEVLELYGQAHTLVSEDGDADAFLDNVKAFDWVVLDDYRLGLGWERQVAARGGKICVIDDLLRQHDCDVLVDMRWRGRLTQSAYDGLVPAEAITMLGPQFIMLPDVYKTGSRKSRTDRTFTTLFGLGGAGNMATVEAMVQPLLDTGMALEIKIIVGPFAENIDRLEAVASSYDAVSLIRGEFDLYEQFRTADLYIGASGGTLYQLLALGVPALTFAIAANQENDMRCLEDLGHYFHTDHWRDEDALNLPRFVSQVMKHMDRIEALMASARLKIDGYGVDRIAAALLGEEDKPSIPNPSVNTASLSPTPLTDSLSIRPVVDSDINHYRECRNLPMNSEKMIASQEIDAISHYGWWFDVKRESFLLSRDNRPCLYIWHTVTKSEGQEFLTGGWFACTDETNFQDTFAALHWQLEYCDKHHKGIPWVAVINRKNSFVKLLNDRCGFEEVGPDHPFFMVYNDVFHGASHDDFFFVYRSPQTAS